MIYGILRGEIEENWPRIEALCEKYPGPAGLEGLHRSLLSANRQAWVCGDWQAVCITSVEVDRVVIDFVGGSDRFEWMDALEAVLTEWARHLGKPRLHAMARPGWARSAKLGGWREIYREFVKDVA